MGTTYELVDHPDDALQVVLRGELDTLGPSSFHCLSSAWVYPKEDTLLTPHELCRLVCGCKGVGEHEMGHRDEGDEATHDWAEGVLIPIPKASGRFHLADEI